jgi:MoaA/NifB/PqqE/SkfB family radical SAM enzyme
MPSPADIATRIRAWSTDGQQGPMTLEVYPTLACNLNCSFCDTTDRHRAPVDELSPARWLEIIDEAAVLGVQRVFVLGGGEPLLRKDVTPQLMARVKEHGMEGILTTNGTLLSAELSHDLIEMGWDEIHFSVDGPTPAIHDTLRGQRGAFDRTIRAACRLAVLKRQRGLESPRIALHFVLTRDNHRTLSEMVRLGHSLGAFRIDFDSLIAYTPAQQALALDAAALAEVPQLAAEAKRLADELGIQTTLDNFMQPERLQRGETAPPSTEAPGLKGAPCLKAWHYLVVQADGATSPCCVLAGEGGSVAQKSLEEVWASDPFMLSVRQGMEAHQPLQRCRECSWNILQHEARIREEL